MIFQWFQVSCSGLRHSQCEQFLHNITPSPFPGLGDSQCEYTITCVGVLFSATATGANMNLLLGKCMYRLSGSTVTPIKLSCKKIPKI